MLHNAAEPGNPATPAMPSKLGSQGLLVHADGRAGKARASPGTTQYQRRAQPDRGLFAACCLALIRTAKCLTFIRGLQMKEQAPFAVPQ